MRIAYFIESLPPNIDGVSRTFIQLVGYLLRHDIEFRFYSPFVPDESYPWAGRVKKVVSIPFILYKAYRWSMPGISNLIPDLDTFAPDLVHVTSPTLLGGFGYNYAAERNIPAVASYHTHFVSYFKYYRLRTLETIGWNILRNFYNRSRATYVPSATMMKELVARDFRNLHLWGRGIDLEKFSPSRRSAELRETAGADDLPVILYVGRLVKEKDLFDVVKVYHELKKLGKRFRMVFVGDGPLKTYLKKEMPDAYFAGFQQDEPLWQWYASGDIFLFPSTTEAFGNVVQEALASGVPSVGAAAGGVADLIADGRNGFLVEPGDIKGYVTKVALLLDNPDLRKKFSRNARTGVKKNSWDHINYQLVHSYETVLSAHHRRKPGLEKDEAYEYIS